MVGTYGDGSSNFGGPPNRHSGRDAGGGGGGSLGFGGLGAGFHAGQNHL